MAIVVKATAGERLPLRKAYLEGRQPLPMKEIVSLTRPKPRPITSQVLGSRSILKLYLNRRLSTVWQVLQIEIAGS